MPCKLRATDLGHEGFLERVVLNERVVREADVHRSHLEIGRDKEGGKASLVTRIEGELGGNVGRTISLQSSVVCLQEQVQASTRYYKRRRVDHSRRRRVVYSAVSCTPQIRPSSNSLNAFDPGVPTTTLVPRIALTSSAATPASCFSTATARLLLRA